jgi:hypothetical protein
MVADRALFCSIGGKFRDREGGNDMRILFGATIALSMMACANARPVSDSSGKSKPTLASNAGGPNAKGKYVCEYEEDTGSHLRQKVCRYVDSNNDARGQTQDQFRQWNSQQWAPSKGN